MDKDFVFLDQPRQNLIHKLHQQRKYSSIRAFRRNRYRNRVIFRLKLVKKVLVKQKTQGVKNMLKILNKNFLIEQINSFSLLLITINIPLWVAYLLYSGTKNELFIILLKVQIWLITSFFLLPLMIVSVAIDKILKSNVMLSFSSFLSTTPDLFSRGENLLILSIILCGVSFCLAGIYGSLTKINSLQN